MLTDRSLRILIALCLGVGLLAPALAGAQGNSGRPKTPKGQSQKESNAPSAPSPTAPSTTAAPAPGSSSGPMAAPTITVTPTPASRSGDVLTGQVLTLPTAATTFRQFGSWLDDASTVAPGQGQMSIGVGHWRMAGGSQTNFPMLGVGMGVTDRVQMSASVPFYRASYDGAVARGMDDVYLSAKVNLVDPTLTLNEFGLSVSPVMEILSAGAPDGRVHFAIPVNLEVRRAPMRVYGSAGYFTRGAMFSGAAVEWSGSRGLTLTGVLTQSYSIKEDPTLDGLGVSARHADVSASVAYPVKTAAVYASVGRSLNSVETGGTNLSLSGGIAMSFTSTRAIPFR